MTARAADGPPQNPVTLQPATAIFARWSGAIAVAFALVLAYGPVVLILATGIWAPSAMTQEMFSHYYATRLVLGVGYFFVPTGHFFAVYLYPVSLFVDAVFGGASHFTRFHIFTIGVHLWNGTFMLLVFLATTRLPLAATERWLLLVVAFGQAFLMRFMTFGIGTNYHTLEQLLLLVLAVVTIHILFGGRTPSLLVTALLGSLAAVAMGTKLSLLVMMGPPLFLVATPWRLRHGLVLRAWVVFCSSLALTYVSLMSIYFLFQLQFWPTFISAMVEYFSGSNISQRNPFLMTELLDWFNPASFYFGFQILITICAVLLILATVLAVMRRCAYALAFLVANIPAILVLLLQFSSRRTVGTMLDVSLYLAFGVTTFGVLCLRLGGVRKLVQGLTAAMIVGCILAVVAARPGEVFHRLIINSQLGRQIDAILTSRPDLPVVFYVDGWDQPLIFPSGDFFGVVGLAPNESVTRYRERYYPRTRYVSPSAGPVPEPHIAVIPEYVDLLPATPENLAEWPQMWPRVEILGVQPGLTAFAADSANACQRFQFVAQDSTRLHAFYGYATRVTVCVASPAP